MEDRDVAGARARVGERPHLVAEVVVDRQREEIRVVALRAEEIPYVPGAVADGVAPVRRRHPLIDDHRSASASQASSAGAAIDEAFGSAA